MRLLLVGAAPETGRLAHSLVLAGSGNIIHCGAEQEALRLVQSGVSFDWILAEVNAAPNLSEQISQRPHPAPAITFLDWSVEPAVRQRGGESTGLVREGESPWVLEYHVPRRRGSLA